MRVIYYLLFFSACCTVVKAQTPDSTGIIYVVDTIASPNCYQSGDGAILLDEVWVPGTIDRYEWTDGSTTEDLIFVNGGTYQLTIYNTDGESFSTEEFFIHDPDSLHITSFISPPTADALDNGFVELTMNGGTAPYELTMIFNQDTSIVASDSFYTVQNVDTGAYIFAVLDARGCTDTVSYTITEFSCKMLVTALVEPAECNTVPNGRIELLIENAVEPYTIEWATKPDDQKVQTNLVAGLYKFSIRDRRNCVIEDSIEIVNDDRIPPEAVVRNNIVLYLNSNGEAEITPRDILIGARDRCHNDLTYQFEKTTFTCNDVGVSEVNFHVIDGVGNSSPYPIQIDVRDTTAVELIFQDTVYTSLCNGIALYDEPKVRGSCAFPSSGGVVKATTREITSPGVYEDRYYYLRNSGDTLRANVTVIVADNRVRSFLIVTEPTCNKGEDGSIAVALRNFEEPVSYQWTDGSTENYLFGIHNQQEYSVKVTEGSGCVFVLSAFLEGPDSLQVELQQLVEKENTIDLIPEIMGGNLPLQYTWYRDGRIVGESQNLLNVADGERYMLQVTDAEGCISSPLIVDRVMSGATPELTNEVDVYPNPVSQDFLRIRFEQNVSMYSQIRIIDSKFQTVSHMDVLEDEIMVPMHRLPAGIYVIQFLREDGQMFSKKIIRL